MRTTLDLPKDTIDEAMKAAHINTKTQVIITALEDLIRKLKISGLKEFKGKIDLDIDMNTLRGRRDRIFHERRQFRQAEFLIDENLIAVNL